MILVVSQIFVYHILKNPLSFCSFLPAAVVQADFWQLDMDIIVGREYDCFSFGTHTHKKVLWIKSNPLVTVKGISNA
jgi:hypothetical protein